MLTLRQVFVVLSAIVVASMLASGTARAQMTVVGNWEQFDPNSPPGGGNFNSDGWIDWANNGGNMNGPPVTDPQYTTTSPPKYSSSTTGATLGSRSLELQYGGGYQQNLSLKMEWTTGDMAAFFSNKAFALDITYPSHTAADNASGGYQEISQFNLNGPGVGFTSITPQFPVPTTQVGFAPNTASNQTTVTMRVDYGDLLSSFTPPTPPATLPQYAEIIMATGSDSSSNPAHGTFFFDNARLYTPGDMNNDGHVDAKDIPAMELALTNPTAYKNTYWAGNTNYTDADRILIGDMQGADLNIGPGPNGIRMVGDGVFNGADLQYLIAYLQDGAGSTSTVPEPATLTLFILAGPGLWWMAHRKRKTLVN